MKWSTSRRAPLASGPPPAARCRVAARIGESEHHRPASRVQGIGGEDLAAEVREVGAWGHGATRSPEQVDWEPPLSGQGGEHDHPAVEVQQLGRRQGAEPGDRARLHAIVNLPGDEALHAAEDPAAREGLPSGWGSVELAETVAVGFGVAHQVGADPGEERQCPKAATKPWLPV